MFNGIRPIGDGPAGRWQCYDTGTHAIFGFKGGRLVMIIHQYKPNPAGGWYRTELARMG